MDSLKHEQRAVIKFLTKEGCKAKEIHDRMCKVMGKDASDYSTVCRWSLAFKRGRESIDDDPRPGRPSDVIVPDTIAAIERRILSDRRVKVSELANEFQISVGSVETIIHEHLGMSKVSARWVPRNLSAGDRHQRTESSRELLDLYNTDEEEFLSRLVTGDETWIHHWDPETKLESMQWKHPNSPPPKKFRTQPSAGKVMATIFWDAKGILLIDYMPPKTTINGQYYANLMKELRKSIRQKRRGMLTRGVLLLHDNAPVHKSRVAQASIRECGFEQLNHPPYSPDLAPSDYFLFRQMKSALRGRRFQHDDEIKAATEAWLEAQSEDFYKRGIKSLKDKWNKCIEVNGHYIEK